MTKTPLLGFLLAGALAAGCGAHHKATPANPDAPQFELTRPGPAQAETARLVTAAGEGAHRLALWIAQNSAGDLCVGWRLGAASPPTEFRCQRHGLERPVLWVQGGGGASENVDWGGDVGLVAPSVTRVVADGKPLALQPVAQRPGWHVFAQGSDTRPASELDAYAGSRTLLEDSGLWINREGQGCDCKRDAHGWSGTYAYVPEQQHGDDANALDAGLALPAVVSILREHGPAWIDLPEGWQKCIGGAIGVIADLRLWKAASFFATLPFEETGVSGTHTPYVTGVHRVFTTQSDELQIWFDAHSNRVVGVTTTSEQGVEIPLATVQEPVPSGGYDDPSQCPSGD